MRGAASDDDATDGGIAVVAGFLGATKDSDEVLLLALRAVDVGVVAERGAAVGDAVFQNSADGGVQLATLGGTERTGGRFGIEARQVEGLVSVDVADPGDVGLIEQGRLDCNLPAAQRVP